MAHIQVTVNGAAREADVEPRMLLVELQQIDRQIRITHEEQLILQQQAAQELVRGLAHEIKNPLGGIRGAAQLLELELDEEELKDYTRVIMKEADRLRNLVNRLLGPNQLPKVEEINIHEVLERVRQLLRVEHGNNLVIHFDYDSSIPTIMGDTDQLIQALLNIAKNAARVLGDDGELMLRTRILRQFTIGSQRHKLVAEIDIEDNGPGIPEALREAVTEAVAPTDATSSGSTSNTRAAVMAWTSSPEVNAAMRPGSSAR